MKKQKILTLFVTVMLALTLSADVYARSGRSRGSSHYGKHIAAAGLAVGTGVAAHSAYSHAKSTTNSKKDNVAPANATSSDSGYYIGKRGGCYTYSSSGNKRYVDHSFCK